MANEKPRGLSVWESELLDHVTEHTRTEGQLLGTYKQLGEESGSQWVHYVARLIEEDEVRHHRIFDELANALRETVQRGVGESVPTVARDVTNPRELLSATDRLLASEQRDAKELRKLSRRLRSMRGVSLWPLLVDMMRHDTEKHIALLSFVHDRLREQVR